MRRFAIAVVILGALASAGTLAQGRRGGTGGARAAAVVWNFQSTLLLFTAELDLSAAQQQQLLALFSAAAQTAAPLSVRVDDGAEGLFAAVKSGRTEDEWQRLAEEQGKLKSELLALQARTFSKMWALLTDAQKAKVDATTYAHIGQFLAIARPSS